MKNNRCLYCYQPLKKEEIDFHQKCSETFFGTSTQPQLNLDKDNLNKLAKEIIIRSVAITGVQPKLSLTIEKNPGNDEGPRMTIVGLWGNFILKPQSTEHPFLPENEDLTMHLSQIFGINTADHSLMRTTSGELAYIVKRFDRINKDKLQCEDLCQLSELLTEAKYRSSMEKTGKIIKLNVANPILDAISFFEIALLSFITGNADMHLKNFSILKDEKNRYNLSPAYDLVNTKLAVPDDKEEMALTINARKNKITINDFNVLAKSLGLNDQQIKNTYTKFSTRFSEMQELINKSFLPENLKESYKDIFLARTKRLFPSLVENV
jgi:serine/threonine-protein kinase HipA